MNPSKLKVCAYIILLLISPFMYVLIQGYSATLHIPSILALEIKSKFGMASLIVFESFIGSTAFGVLISMPMGYMANKKHFLSSGLLYFVVALYILIVRSSIDMEEYDHSNFVNYGELVLLLVSVIITGKLGSVLKKVSSNAAT